MFIIKHLEMSSAKCQPFSSSHTMLIHSLHVLAMFIESPLSLLAFQLRLICSQYTLYHASCTAHCVLGGGVHIKEQLWGYWTLWLGRFVTNHFTCILFVMLGLEYDSYWIHVGVDMVWWEYIEWNYNGFVKMDIEFINKDSAKFFPLPHVAGLNVTVWVPSNF